MLPGDLQKDGATGMSNGSELVPKPPGVTHYTKCVPFTHLMKF
jgi:hypothetical protein